MINVLKNVKLVIIQHKRTDNLFVLDVQVNVKLVLLDQEIVVLLVN
jgi:hypothetical protein